MFISAFPTLKSSLLKGNNIFIEDKISLIYESTNFEFFYFGRSAIWNAIKLLRLTPEDDILMPSYHCSVEIETVLQAGVKIKFFEVKEDMSADLNDIEKKIDNKTKAIFIIHYFGFPQPIDDIKNLCKSKGLFLIEDCAHAFMSRGRNKCLGTYGDFGILSMQKFLPLPNGGVLLINNPQLRESIELYYPNKKSVIRSLLLLLLNNIRFNHSGLYQITNLLFFVPARKAFRVLRKNFNMEVVSPASIEFSPEMGKLGMSKISKKILSNINLEEIVAHRRANYNLLLEWLKDIPGVKVCFPSLAPGICPYFLPIDVKNRDLIYRILLQKGISTFIFGEFLHGLLPEGGFTTARYLSKNILALPIHQDLNPSHIGYMAENLKKILKNPREIR